MNAPEELLEKSKLERLTDWVSEIESRVLKLEGSEQKPNDIGEMCDKLIEKKLHEAMEVREISEKSSEPEYKRGAPLPHTAVEYYQQQLGKLWNENQELRQHLAADDKAHGHCIN